MAASGDVPAFPRGGKEILTSKEKKRIRQEAFKEAEADLVSTKATVNRQKRQRRNQQHTVRCCVVLYLDISLLGLSAASLDNYTVGFTFCGTLH